MNEIDLQPHLHTDLLDMRPLSAEDWKELFAAASDPLIWAADKKFKPPLRRIPVRVMSFMVSPSLPPTGLAR